MVVVTGREVGAFVAGLSLPQRRDLARVVRAGLAEVSAWSSRNGLGPVSVLPARDLLEALEGPVAVVASGPPVLVPLPELSESLGVPESTLSRWRRDGLIRSAEQRRGRWCADPREVEELERRRASDPSRRFRG